MIYYKVVNKSHIKRQGHKFNVDQWIILYHFISFTFYFYIIQKVTFIFTI